VRQLAAAGNDVIVVDNLVNGRAENIQSIPGDNVRLEVEDIRDTAKMRALVDGVDVVFHLACLGVRHSIHSPIENHEVNARATLDLLAESRAADVKRFVYVSSSEVYGTARTVPMTEEHPTFPMTVYGAAKLAGDCYTRAFYETYRFPTVVVRPFNTYGPNCHHEGDSGEVIPKFLLRSLAGRPLVIFGDGTQTRDFTYVSDTAAGIILAASSDRAVGTTINIGNGREIPVSELATEVAAVAGRPDATVEYDEPRPGDVLRLYADITRARETLGYAPSISLRQGLGMLKSWYDAREESPEELLESEIVRNWQRD
jgi:UDP-glucose 4-epimerase